MLPNHAPLVIAEQFGTLNTLYLAVLIWGWGVRRVATSRPCAPCVAI